MALIDPHGRTVDYLRISVTDRCNFRCVYCMPEEGAPTSPRPDLLTDDEIERVVRVSTAVGIRRIRLTGGEPLVRPGIAALVRRVASAGDLIDLSLTTNGFLLARHAAEMAAGGLRRVNISLDTLRPDRFKAIARRGDLMDVMGGIDAALAGGLTPIKLNMVVMRGVNDDEAPAFARLTLDRPFHVRFIELMPIRWSQGDEEAEIPWALPGAAPAGGVVRLQALTGGGRGNGTDRNGPTRPHLESLGTGVLDGRRMRAMFVPATEVRARVEQVLGPLLPADVITNGPARAYRLAGSAGTVGFISQVTDDMCSRCNRLRLTADGFLRPCLMSDGEVDLRTPLRSGADDERLADVFRAAAGNKPLSHRLRDGLAPGARNMSQLGG